MLKTLKVTVTECRAAYDEKHPQPKKHKAPNHPMHGKPTMLMPGGICSDKEVQHFIDNSDTMDEVVKKMADARGNAGMK